MMALRVARPKGRGRFRPRSTSTAAAGCCTTATATPHRRLAGGRRHRRRGAGIPEAARGRLSGLGRRQSSRDPLAESECRGARQPAGSGRRDRHIERRASVDALRAAAPTIRAMARSRCRAPAYDATLAFAVACWSVFDPLARYPMVRERGVKHLLAAHAATGPTKPTWRRAIRSSSWSAASSRNFPLLVIQGTKDDNLTDDMADRFVARLPRGRRRRDAEEIRRQAARLRHPRAGRRRVGGCDRHDGGIHPRADVNA